LIDAIDKFDTEKNVKFETYASLRIRGSILDQIRKMDWIPRTVRQRQRKMDEAIKQVEMRTGKSATDEELAKELGLTESELGDWQSQLKVTNVVSLNEFEENNGPEPVADTTHQSHFKQPEEVVEEEELKKMLEKALTTLTEKERRVIELYYYEDMNLKEISQILEVSESRVSQLHTKGLLKMRKRMGPYMNILTEQ
jgi:RNA polymerase sigma factor for flagellar operon FliA